MDFDHQEMTDQDGRRLLSPKIHDPLRLKPVWAVYKFWKGIRRAASQESDFLHLAAAREAADSLNIRRAAGEEHYFKLYRLAEPRESEISE